METSQLYRTTDMDERSKTSQFSHRAKLWDNYSKEGKIILIDNQLGFDIEKTTGRNLIKSTSNRQ